MGIPEYDTNQIQILKDSFIPRTIRSWNALDEGTRRTPPSKFSCVLRKKLMSLQEWNKPLIYIANKMRSRTKSIFHSTCTSLLYCQQNEKPTGKLCIWLQDEKPPETYIYSSCNYVSWTMPWTAKHQWCCINCWWGAITCQCCISLIQYWNNACTLLALRTQGDFRAAYPATHAASENDPANIIASLQPSLH